MSLRVDIDGTEIIYRIKFKAVNVQPVLLSVWRMKSEIAFKDPESWMEAFKANVNNESAFEKLYEREQVADLGLSEEESLIIRMPRGYSEDDKVDDKGSEDDLGGSKESKLYMNTLGYPGKSPSEGAKSTAYCRSQADETLVIYDGRTPWDRDVSTIAPPIQLFHPIFDEFTRAVNDPNVQPTVKDLLRVHNLMHTLSEVGQLDDMDYGERVYERLSVILDVIIEEQTSPDRSSPERVIMEVNTMIPCAFVELQPEIGEGGCDVTSKASLAMRRFWVHTQAKTLREKCCCPTFLIATGGPWLCVLGGVFTDKFIIQRLTEMRWMGVSSSEEDERIYNNARVLVALRESLKNLKDFYYKTFTSKSTPLLPNKPHPRYFPYPTSFAAADGTLTSFLYQKSLEYSPKCVTYLAEITDEEGMTRNPPDQVVVKFVGRYGIKVHEFLADEGWAPRLRHYGRLREAAVSDEFRGPGQRAPASLRMESVIYMVVMDYIDGQPKPPPRDARAQIEEVLNRLHAKGYVFGDLRLPNILFDTDNKVKLIDFDWSGRYKMKNSEEKPADRVQKETENADNVEDEEGQYAHYPLAMSTIPGMWAKGMEPLGAIRPEHDWNMFDKLCQRLP